MPWASPRLHDLAALGKMADPRFGAPPVRSLSRFADIVGRCIQVRHPSCRDLRIPLSARRAPSTRRGRSMATDVCELHLLGKAWRWQQEAEFRPAMSQVAQGLRRALEDARAEAGSGGAAQA